MSAYIGGITEHLSHGPVEPDDVPLGRERGRALPGFARGAEVDAREPILGDDEREARRRDGHHRRCAIDDCAHRRVAAADDLVVGDERAEPVREVDDVRAGDAGEEILVAARKADDFVREDRSADDDPVVIEDAPVERHGHRFFEPPAGELRDLGRGNFADRGEGRGVGPFVVEDPALARAAVDDRHADESGKLRVVHGPMGAQRHQEIERGHLAGEHFPEESEELRHRHRSRAVGDDEQNALAGEGQRGQAGADDLARFFRRQETVGVSDTFHEPYRTARGARAGHCENGSAQSPGGPG